MSASTTQQHPNAGAELRELTGADLTQVGGGMKWERGHRSPNVIDGRGGQGSFGPIHWTLDINGKVSSVEIR